MTKNIWSLLFDLLHQPPPPNSEPWTHIPSSSSSFRRRTAIPENPALSSSPLLSLLARGSIFPLSVAIFADSGDLLSYLAYKDRFDILPFQLCHQRCQLATVCRRRHLLVVHQC
ncbi:hypothetical protein AAHA92_22161 [Salvia divinorum]|uniref:Uncharacterized protein n=1 Tax=Salvia divinorum TaxID=28513 RepID=A0ABD1GQP7_SALDI